jgi:hypothetical protein
MKSGLLQGYLGKGTQTLSASPRPQPLLVLCYINK